MSDWLRPIRACDESIMISKQADKATVARFQGTKMFGAQQCAADIDEFCLRSASRGFASFGSYYQNAGRLFYSEFSKWSGMLFAGLHDTAGHVKDMTLR